MAKLALWTTCARLVCSAGDSTDISDRLNAEIAGSGGAYTAGKGLLVRTPDFFGGDTAVVPATLWSNDIFAPSQLYPASGNPMCPSSGDGWSELSPDCSSGSPWERATVAVVISSSMPSLMEDWDNIQDADWGWGVFYPFDSNSCDGRCRWLDSLGGWDCPGGWMDGDGVTYTEDANEQGSGAYEAGNPYTGGGGGGTGCHINGGAFDQMDAEDVNLVQDSDCQCNYVFNDDWEHWVQQWMGKGTQKEGFEWRGWFWNGKAPVWAVDASMCWVNNIRDMIALQNAMYWNADSWNNQLVPESSWGSGSDQDRMYWGWNEIPVRTSAVEDPLNWDSVIIKLPADICGNGGGDDAYECMHSAQQHDLLTQLKAFENAGKLLTGLQHVTERPGSYILFVREYRVDGGWARYFFCRHAAFFDRAIRSLHGACYYDKRLLISPTDDEDSTSIDVI